MPNFATNNRGQIAVLALVITVVLASFAATITGTLLSSSRILRQATEDSLGTQLAESGIDKALWCLNHPVVASCTNYTGETQTQGAGSFTVTTTTSGNTSTVVGTGKVNGQTHSIQMTLANQSSQSASFFYGVQTGVGGVTLSNNAKIVGNLYTSGSVTGTNGSSITGDVILTPGSPTLDVTSNPPTSPLTTVNFGAASATTYLYQSFVAGYDDRLYSVDLKLAKHSAPASTVTLYVYTDSANAPGTNISGSGQVVTATIPADTSSGWENGWTTQTFGPQTQLVSGTKYWLVMKVSATNASKYWVSVQGVDATYGNGTYTARTGSVLTSNTAACGTACDIAFRTHIGGVEPTLNIPTVGGNMYAYNIDSTSAGKDAYYQQLSGTVKANTTGAAETCSTSSNGTHCHRNSTDQAPQNFPLSDAQIATMESQATNGGVVTCSPTCSIPAGSTIGPKQYNGDITLNGTVTLNGTIWVNGNITITNNAILKLSSGYGASSGVIIADNPSNPSGSGIINLSNNGDLQGNGTAGTYIMALSMNGDPTFSTPSINVSNNLTAGILYAQNGRVDIANNAALKEVTAQQLNLSNNATVTYESGLASLVFTSGPGGSWQPAQQTWQDLH